MNELIHWILISLVVGFLFAFLTFLFIEPFNRVNILRKLTKKNYGIIFLIGRGKQITTLIRNLDDDTIWIDNNVWVIEPNKIYRKDNNTNINAIDSKHIHIISGVPIVFLSLDSMKPLDFFTSESEVKPEEIGATLRGWLYNQYAKMLFFKRTFEIVILILGVLLLAVLYFSYSNFSTLQETTKIAKETLEIVKNLTITTVG